MSAQLSYSGWPDWLTTTNHIGSHYPFFIEEPDEQRSFSLRIGEIIDQLPKSKRTVDPAGVVEMMFSGRPLANRTLVQGVSRSPWLAAPVDGGWHYHNVPSHNQCRLPCHGVTSKLHELLREEIISYTSEYETIGILLSGGLDSRILAGLLRSLQHEEKVDEVIALTWGLEQSRDVVYARQIAVDYDWEFRHYPLSAESLQRNIELNGKLGAEVSPIHLHAMPEVREEKDLDVVLAGSYGNSVGRAKYAGDHVTELGPLIPRWLNRFGAMKHWVIDHSKTTIHGDAYGYRSRISREKLYQYRELEQQMHYMRRNLQTCMTHIAEEIPLYQIFTRPEVAELMWGLHPSVRDERYYVDLLEQLPGNLTAIPDPKMGTRPGTKTTVASSELSTVYSDYGNWLREDLNEYVREHVTTALDRSSLFNEKSIHRLLEVWERAGTKTRNRIDSIIAKLASFAVFLNTYDIRPVAGDTLSTYRDIINQFIGPGQALAYQTAREYVRE